MGGVVEMEKDGLRDGRRAKGACCCAFDWRLAIQRGFSILL